MTSCLMSSMNMELPLERTERPERDCGRDENLGVGGWSSMSLPTIDPGFFSDMAEVGFRRAVEGVSVGDGLAVGRSALK